MDTIIDRANLSKREFEVMLIASCGKLDKEIATILNCKPTTVSKHMQHIFLKWGVQNRVEAIILFLQITGKINTENERDKN